MNLFRGAWGGDREGLRGNGFALLRIVESAIEFSKMKIKIEIKAPVE